MGSQEASVSVVPVSVDIARSVGGSHVYKRESGHTIILAGAAVRYLLKVSCNLHAMVLCTRDFCLEMLAVIFVALQISFVSAQFHSKYKLLAISLL